MNGSPFHKDRDQVANRQGRTNPNLPAGEECTLTQNYLFDKMRIGLERRRKCIKELHEFIYTHLNIKCFNMFYSKRKLQTRIYNASVYTRWL